MLATNQGSVLLIRNGNPKNIRTIAGLMREDVRLFISNPETKKVSHDGYRQTLLDLAAGAYIPPNTGRQTIMGGFIIVFIQRLKYGAAGSIG